jgi:hypothetical protein
MIWVVIYKLASRSNAGGLGFNRGRIDVSSSAEAHSKCKKDLKTFWRKCANVISPTLKRNHEDYCRRRVKIVFTSREIPKHGPLFKENGMVVHVVSSTVLH